MKNSSLKRKSTQNSSNPTGYIIDSNAEQNWQDELNPGGEYHVICKGAIGARTALGIAYQAENTTNASHRQI